MLMLALDVLMRAHMRVFRILGDPSLHHLCRADPWDVRDALAIERSKVRYSLGNPDPLPSIGTWSGLLG